MARDKQTKIHMCHVFRCDSAPAKDIANALKETCRRVIAESKLALGATSGGSSTTDSINSLIRPNFLPDISVNTNKVDINLKLRSISYNRDINESANAEAATHSVPLTPMDEPSKKHKCKYLGNVSVTKPYGMDVLNDAIEKIYTQALDDYKKLKKEKKMRRQRKINFLNRGFFFKFYFKD